jgi:hypothetical protein
MNGSRDALEGGLSGVGAWLWPPQVALPPHKLRRAPRLSRCERTLAVVRAWKQRSLRPTSVLSNRKNLALHATALGSRPCVVPGVAKTLARSLPPSPGEMGAFLGRGKSFAERRKVVRKLKNANSVARQAAKAALAAGLAAALQTTANELARRRR